MLDLFLTFVKIGLFTFGGGYAMIPLIEENCVEKKKWISHEDMMNITVIAESTPGPIAINCATFVGYKQKGLKGALATTLGVVLPSFIIIYVISNFLDRFLEIEVVASAFKGINIGVSILIINAAIKMIKKMKRNKLTIGIMIITFVLMLVINIFSLKISSIVLMLTAGFIALMIGGLLNHDLS